MRPKRFDVAQRLSRRLSLFNQPTTNHRPRATDTTPAVHVGRAPVGDLGANAFEDARHECGRRDISIAYAVAVVAQGDLRVARKRVEQWLVRLEAVRGLGQVDEGSDARADERLEPSLSTVGPWVAGVLAR